MTKEQFDNQQWYKNMPVWIKGEKCYVFGVDFVNNKISVIPKIGADSGATWDFSLVNIQPKPSALDLIAQEREKQISKGYTVEHDAAYVEETGVGYDEIAIRLMQHGECPPNWDKDYWNRLLTMCYSDRLRIAGAWFVAELDRHNYHILKP